jgi:hypothetical protein
MFAEREVFTNSSREAAEAAPTKRVESTNDFMFIKKEVRERERVKREFCGEGRGTKRSLCFPPLIFYTFGWIEKKGKAGRE